MTGLLLMGQLELSTLKMKGRIIYFKYNDAGYIYGEKTTADLDLLNIDLEILLSMQQLVPLKLMDP